MSLSKLEKFSCEILEEIVLWLVQGSFLGPPKDLFALLTVSRHIWNVLAPDNHPYLYSRVFALKFDIRAPLLRHGNKSQLSDYSTALARRFESLKRLKNGSDAYPYDTACLRIDLWTAYTMFLESDAKNVKQLIEYAHIDRFAFEYVSLEGRLHHGKDKNDGWTVDSEENALATWLFWFTDEARVPFESFEDRRKILQALAHLFVGSFKYASTYAPITSAIIPPVAPPPVPPPSRVLSLAASPVSQCCLIPNSFGSDLASSRPLIKPPALLSCVTRLEAAIAEMSWSFPSYIPATRADAIASGWHGPTLEDHAKQRTPTTRFVKWGDTVSERHEQDWMRLRSCYNPWSHRPSGGGVFTPGMLDGIWDGRWFGIAYNQFEDLLQSEQSGRPMASSHPPLVFSVPMKFTIREHHQRDASGVVDFDDISRDETGSGVLNAWFPKNTSLTQALNNLEVHIPGAKKPYIYQTYHPQDAAGSNTALIPRDAMGPFSDSVRDIILTATTDEAFGAAWGHKRYYGRVRAWDGLIVLVREATNAEGQWIFRGYLHAMQNLIGLWRETGASVNLPGWEGVWSMTKAA